LGDFSFLLGKFVVKAGLAGGEKIVLEGIRLIHEGDKVGEQGR